MPPSTTNLPTKALLRQDKMLVCKSHTGRIDEGKPLTCPAATAKNPYPDLKSQKAFEKALLEKTAKQTGDILLFDGRM